MAEKSKRTYDSTVARIAGNVASGLTSGKPWLLQASDRELLAQLSVSIARAIVAEVQRTEPRQESSLDG